MSHPPAHIRGDEIAGTGFGYECLWRSLLMLRLNPGDVLKIYSGEDCRIARADGKITYYQMKHSTSPLTPGALKSFLDRAKTEFTVNASVSFVLCTNAQLTRDAADAMQVIADAFGNRLRTERWEVNPDTPLDRMTGAVVRSVQKAFVQQGVSDVLRIEQVNECCRGVVALEAVFKLEGSPTITQEEVWERSGLKRLIAGIPSQITGSRLLAWPALLELAKTPNSDPVVAALRAVIAGDGIGRDLEEAVFQAAITWLDQPAESKVALISGASGTGKTWLLLQLGQRLAGRCPTYWADEFSTGVDPNLGALGAYENRPTVVLIDDVIEAEWDGVALGGLRSQPPILILATTSTPRYAEQIRTLESRLGGKLMRRDLNPLVSESEAADLVAKLRGGVVARREEQELGSANIRYAARLLRNEAAKPDLVTRYVSFWRQDQLQAWIEPLLLASALNVKLPRSLLREHARAKGGAARELPDVISASLLRSRREDEEFVWLEDREVASEALTLIKEQAGEAAVEAELLREAKRLIQGIKAESGFHRQFGRRMIREFARAYPQYQGDFWSECERKIIELLPFETVTALAYVWLPSLREPTRQLIAKNAARQLVARRPGSVAEVVVFVEAFGDESVALTLTEQLHGAQRWEIEPWAMFIEQVRTLDFAAKREVMSRTVPILQRAPIDLWRLLEVRNVDVELLKLIEGVGSADAREWFLGELNEILPESPSDESLRRQNLLPQYFELVQRCIMQERNGISLTIAEECLSRPLTPRNLLAEAYDRYTELYRKERHRAYEVGALVRGLNYAVAEKSPTKASEIWDGVLRFGRTWAEFSVADALEEQVYEFVKSVDSQGLPVRLFQKPVLTLARGLLRASTVTGPRLRVVMELVRQGPRTQAARQMMALGLAAVTRLSGPDSDVGLRTRRLLVEIVRGGGAAAVEAWNEFLEDLRRLSEADVRKHSDHLSKIVSAPEDPVVIDLLVGIRNVNWPAQEREEIGEALWRRWSGNSVVRRDLLLTLFRLQAATQAKSIIDELIAISTSDPDTLLFACTWEARFGDPLQAVERLNEAMSLTRGKRGRPEQVARAYRDLARCLESPRSDVFKMCSALTQLGPLADVDTVLAGGVPNDVTCR